MIFEVELLIRINLESLALTCPSKLTERIESKILQFVELTSVDKIGHSGKHWFSNTLNKHKLQAWSREAKQFKQLGSGHIEHDDEEMQDEHPEGHEVHVRRVFEK